jgi:hypothetical protein
MHGETMPIFHLNRYMAVQVRRYYTDKARRTESANRVSLQQRRVIQRASFSEGPSQHIGSDQETPTLEQLHFFEFNLHACQELMFSLVRLVMVK